MNIKDIFNIKLTAHYAGKYSIGWETPDARYHIWLVDGMPDGTLYKNAPRGTEKPYNTRHLTVAANRKVVGYVMATMWNDEERVRADQEYVDKRAAEAKAERDKKLDRVVREAAELGYKLVKIALGER